MRTIGGAVKDRWLRGLTSPRSRRCWRPPDLPDLQWQLPALTGGEGVRDCAFAGHQPADDDPPVRRRATVNPLYRGEYGCRCPARMAAPDLDPAVADTASRPADCSVMELVIARGLEAPALQRVREQVGWLVPTRLVEVAAGKVLSAGGPAAPLVATWLLIAQKAAETVPASLDRATRRAYTPSAAAGARGADRAYPRPGREPVQRPRQHRRRP